MNRCIRSSAIALAGLLALSPGAAYAQSQDGWWTWALPDVAGAEYRMGGPATLDRDGRDGYGGHGRVERRRERERWEGTRGRERERERWERQRERERERWERERERERERWERERQRERRARGQRRKGGRGRAGPPFCRNGQGHPVFGMRWCREKGFGGYGRSGWYRASWDDVVFSPRPRRSRRGAVLDRGDLIDILGGVIFGRLVHERDRIRGRAPLAGRWLRTRDGARILQVRAGRVPLAELSDLDGDGRVEITLLRHR